MPFQKGNKYGGRRENAGRKPRNREEELQSLLDEAWPLERRKKAIEVLSSRAEASDYRCLGLLMAYAYGTPPSGDEMRIQEAVDAEFESLAKTLKQSLTPDAWREVAGILGLDEES